ncbi:hypothetical protein [Streptomyces sp. NPDC088258]|uniref:hypothetical protein n=1 Tax=Streptomyces sp. NPDC088258 TaxID=3365849 RepID=UPI00382F8E81
MTVAADATGSEPVRLTPSEAHTALYGPGADPEFSAAIWQAVLGTALADRTSHGPEKLLVIWLALPRLSETADRICDRLHADRSDVEAEMTLALLEGLTASDDPSHVAIATLIDTARIRAWCFARAGMREIPFTQVEDLAQDRAVSTTDETADTPTTTRESLDVRVDRLDGPDGPQAPLRFQVRPEHLREDTFDDSVDETGARRVERGPRKRRIRRRVGTSPIRRAVRRP